MRVIISLNMNLSYLQPGPSCTCRRCGCEACRRHRLGRRWLPCWTACGPGGAGWAPLRCCAPACAGNLWHSHSGEGVAMHLSKMYNSLVRLVEKVKKVIKWWLWKSWHWIFSGKSWNCEIEICLGRNSIFQMFIALGHKAKNQTNTVKRFFSNVMITWNPTSFVIGDFAKTCKRSWNHSSHLYSVFLVSVSANYVCIVF